MKTESFNGDQADLDRVIALILRRLDVMHQMARWKYLNKCPVWRPIRETELHQHISRQACELVADVAWVHKVLQGQMDAAKVIQWIDLDQWRMGERDECKSLILLENLRDEIDKLTGELSHALCHIEKLRRHPDFKRYIQSQIDILSKREKGPPLVWKLA